MAVDFAERLLESCLRIRNFTELRAFREWIDIEYERVMKALIENDSDRNTAVLQGKAQVFAQLKKMIETSSDELSRFEARRKAKS